MPTEIVDHGPTMTGGGQQIQSKDKDHQEAAATIYDITDACFDVLERLVSVSDTYPLPQLEPFISDEALCNESSRDIRGLRNSFAFWADYTGALAPVQASLDYRLQNHDQVKEMVIELLEMVERNLCRLEQSHEKDPRFSNTESRRTLSAVDSALDRLNFLARAIRKASVRSQEQDLLNFTNDEDKLFRKFAISYVKRKYPNARSSLREHMGNSIAAHRRVLLLKHQHASKLKLRRAPKPLYHQKVQQPPLATSKIEHLEIPVSKVFLHSQSSMAADSRITQASQMDGKRALQIIHQKPTLSIRSSGSFQPEDSTQMQYPDPPRINPGERYAQCPYCMEPLLEVDLLRGSKNKYWVNHVNQDLHPYICLFPRCTNSEFASRSEWSKHMAASHSKEWPRKVHATTWYCNLDHDTLDEFDNEEDWRKHMLTPSLHRSRSKLPTDTQLDALAVRKQQLALRDLYICPFCEDKPEQIEKLGDRGNPSDMEIILINHIAEHVKLLLLLALPALDSEVADDERKSATYENSSYKRLRNSDLSFRAPSGVFDMENISLTFDEYDGTPEAEGNTKPDFIGPEHVMKLVDNVDSVDGAEVDHDFALIPNTETSFSWDFILPEGWAWDRAYDSLKAEIPSIIEAYEKLLSGVMFADAPDPQNENVSRVIQYKPNTNMVTRRDMLHQIADRSLKHCGKSVDKTLLGHEIIPQHRIKDMAGIVRWAENHIKDTVRDLPYTSIIVAGVALVLPLLGNPNTVEAANQDGFIYIASRMRYYATLEPFLLFEDLKPDSKKDLSDRVVKLYKLIISFQARNILRFYGSRTNSFFLKDISYDDWDRRLQDIKDNSATIISNFSVSTVTPENNSDLLNSSQQTLKRLANEAEVSYTTLSSNLEAARKLDIEPQEWDSRKQCDERSSVLDELDVKEHIHGFKRYALLVGIDLYLNDGSRNLSSHGELPFHNLRGCINDVEALYTFLQDDYEFANISILTSSLPALGNQESATISPIEPQDRLPTFANIKAEFDNVYNRAVAGDFFFFHYSGHGSRLNRIRGSPLPSMTDPSLITVDFCCGQPAVRGWQLNEWLEKLNKKGIQVVVTLDSCYSNGSRRSTDDYMSFHTPIQRSLEPNLSIADQVAANSSEASQLVRRGVKLKAPWSINPDSFTIIAACGTGERAVEKVVDGKTYGAFTWELLECLRRVNGELVTYRTITDQLKMRLKDQNPETYGRDKLVFFGSHELIPATPLIVQLEGNKAIVPVGRAHGVNIWSEFRISWELVDATFSFNKVEELRCSGIITDNFSLLLRKVNQCVFPSRWSLGEKEPLRVYVDLAFGSGFRDQLQKQLKERIVGPIELLESTEYDVLRLDKLGEDDATIRGPAWLTGSDDPVGPLNLRYGNINELVTEAALALAHLARFRQILLLKAQRSSKPPFVVSIQPVNGNVANPHPLNQRFKFTFQNKSDEELYITVIIFRPEFSIEQLYPPRDYPQPIYKRQRKSFAFFLTPPNAPEWVQESRCYTFRRDIVRTLVTKGIRVSWKSLELPNIWDTSRMDPRKKQSSMRESSSVHGPETDWWSHDEEIVIGSAGSV
ncbi:hypothetical protein Trisim1_004349 [Trichoderma cf. simile WF8]